MHKDLDNVKNIYLIGIGGIGMSGLAALLKRKGFNVSGSDKAFSKQTDKLLEEGINVFLGHDAKRITLEIDLVCYSSAIDQNNPELFSAVTQKIKVLRRADLLGLISWDKKVVAVSGSHGKTTTTAFIAYLLQKLGYSPTVFLGGHINQSEENAWWGSEYCVIEADESDNSFLSYNCWASIITNIDYEHLDYHKNIKSLQENFLKFASLTKGVVIGCRENKLVAEILDKVKSISYGFSSDHRVSASEIVFDKESTSYKLRVDQKCYNVCIPLLGEHNVLNSLAVISFFLYIGEDLTKVIKLFSGFPGTKRRFQKKAVVGGVTFVDDYAHHPTEIKAVISAASRLGYKRVVAVFQPHRFSRVQALAKDFITSFSLVDLLVITDIYAAGEKNVYGIESMNFAQFLIKQSGVNACYLSRDKLAQEIIGLLSEGDLVLGLGAGDINYLLEGVYEQFSKIVV